MNLENTSKIDEILHSRNRKEGVNGYWTTDHEIDFIQALGKHPRHRNVKNRPTYLEYLLLYLQALEHRRNWGNIDCKTVLTFINSEIDRLGIND